MHFRSEINASATKAKVYIGKDFAAEVHRANGFWRAINAYGNEILKTPHTEIIRETPPGYTKRPIETKREISLGMILKTLRDDLTKRIAQA